MQNEEPALLWLIDFMKRVRGLMPNTRREPVAHFQQNSRVTLVAAVTAKQLDNGKLPLSQRVASPPD